MEKNTGTGVKISIVQALQRTKRMLMRDWVLSDEPTSDTSLYYKPPSGLGKNENQILALEASIESVDFVDVHADVTFVDLSKAKTVGRLCDIIWAGIPDDYKVR
jgi:hypothetical protein